MNVYFAIPSARPASEALPVLAQWSKMGYRVALLRQGEPLGASIEIPTDRYLGWAASINKLAKIILDHDAEAEWIVGGGDDTLPDPNHDAGQIAFECGRHFGEEQQVYRQEATVSNIPNAPAFGRFPWSTMGVVQPIGDLKGWPNSRIDTFAGSPWLGREWCRRAYQGNGPLFAGYPHSWADEELQAVAIKLGVFWQRPDLTHAHLHYLREKRPAPAYADMINRDYGTYRPLFETRKAAGWPGSEPLA